MVDMTHRIQRLPTDEKPAPWKKGLRVMGVSESFDKGKKNSIVVGVVMRGDMRIDGFGVCRPTVGGSDATRKLKEMFCSLNREDIRAWLLGGSMISWFNIIDITELWNHTGIPVACVTYNPSEGVEEFIKEYFPDDWEKRIETIKKCGDREEVTLQNGLSVFLNMAGMSLKEATLLVEMFTLDGRIPEPVRVARMLAQSIRRDLQE